MQAVQLDEFFESAISVSIDPDGSVQQVDSFYPAHLYAFSTMLMDGPHSCVAYLRSVAEPMQDIMLDRFGRKPRLIFAIVSEQLADGRTLERLGAYITITQPWHEIALVAAMGRSIEMAYDSMNGGPPVDYEDDDDDKAESWRGA